MSIMEDHANVNGPVHTLASPFSRLKLDTPVEKDEDDRPQLPREWSSRRKSAIVALVSSLNFLV